MEVGGDGVAEDGCHFLFTSIHFMTGICGSWIFSFFPVLSFPLLFKLFLLIKFIL